MEICLTALTLSIGWDSINILLIKQKDERELTSLYNQMKSWLMYFTKKDEELSNDIFMKIITKIDLFDSKKGKFHNFAYTIALNELYQTKKIKVRKIDLIYTDEPFGDYNFKQSNVDNEEYIDYEQELNKLMSFLPQKDKKFILEYIHSKKVKHPTERERFRQLKNKLKNIYK